jgi:hypothetical protein
MRYLRRSTRPRRIGRAPRPADEPGALGRPTGELARHPAFGLDVALQAVGQNFMAHGGSDVTTYPNSNLMTCKARMRALRVDGMWNRWRRPFKRAARIALGDPLEKLARFEHVRKIIPHPT